MGFHLYAKNTPLRDQGYEVGFALNLLMCWAMLSEWRTVHSSVAGSSHNALNSFFSPGLGQSGSITGGSILAMLDFRSRRPPTRRQRR